MKVVPWFYTVPIYWYFSLPQKNPKQSLIIKGNVPTHVTVKTCLWQQGKYPKMSNHPFESDSKRNISQMHAVSESPSPLPPPPLRVPLWRLSATSTFRKSCLPTSLHSAPQHNTVIESIQEVGKKQFQLLYCHWLYLDVFCADVAEQEKGRKKIPFNQY